VATQIEGELKGSYGFFSADAQTKFSNIKSNHNVDVYCTLYCEGGPAVHIEDPTEPKELLTLANTWMKAMFDDPKRYARPYLWTLSPASIAEGPCHPIRLTLSMLMMCLYSVRKNAPHCWTNLINSTGGSNTRRSMTGLGLGSPHPSRSLRLYEQRKTTWTPGGMCSAAINSPVHALLPAGYAAASAPPQTVSIVAASPVGPRPLAERLALFRLLY